MMSPQLLQFPSLAAAVAAFALLASALAAPNADNWTFFGNDVGAVGPDCPYIDHGDGSSLTQCQASCVDNIGCNTINYNDGIHDCVFRECTDAAHPTLSPAQGYSVWALTTRPPPPPGCWPRALAPVKKRFRVPTADLRGKLSDPPPASWLPGIASSDILWAATDSGLDPRYDLPQIANGFVGTQVMTDSIFVSGVYSGYSSIAPSHRARIPATNAVPAPGNTTAAGWDIRRATYMRRSSIDPGPPGSCTAASTTTCTSSSSRVWVEQRWYAHATIPSLLVMEVEVLVDNHAPAPTSPVAAAAAVNNGVKSGRGGSADPFAMLALHNCPSADSADFNFTSVPVAPGVPYDIRLGTTVAAETNTSGLQHVAVLTTAWPANGMLAVASAGVTSVFLTVIRSDVETPVADLASAVQEDWSAAMELASDGTLHALHVAEWAANYWVGGVELVGRADVARVVNASFGALIGSMRADRPFGACTSGLAGEGNTQTG